MLRRFALVTVPALLLASSPALSQKNLCAQLEKATSTQGTITPQVGDNNVVVVRGPGCFISASLARQGEDPTGVTFVSLEIDGRFVVDTSIEGLINEGATSINTFGVMVQRGDARDSVSIGFPEPLFFRDSLVLGVFVRGPGIVQVIGLVITAQ
jgi:hypothetical protein